MNYVTREANSYKKLVEAGCRPIGDIGYDEFPCGRWCGSCGHMSHYDLETVFRGCGMESEDAYNLERKREIPETFCREHKTDPVNNQYIIDYLNNLPIKK